MNQESIPFPKGMMKLMMMMRWENFPYVKNLRMMRRNGSISKLSYILTITVISIYIIVMS